MQAKVTIDLLPQLIRNRRKCGESPYVLFLGAGASVGSGCPAMSTLAESVVGSSDVNTFYDLVSRMSQSERFSVLSPLLEARAVSTGYQCMAKLIREGFFNLILTTNFDCLVEKALVQCGLQPDQFSVLVNDGSPAAGRTIANVLNNKSPAIKVVKLHGDLYHRNIALSDTEVYRFHQSTLEVLDRIFSEKDVILIGYSMKDPDVHHCVSKEGGSLWYVNLQPPTGEILTAMRLRGMEENCVVGPQGDADVFFERLHEELLGRNVANFLLALGKEHEVNDHDSVLANIEKLFVPPAEFAAIWDCLSRNNVVFVIGDPEVGKTYTAVYLLLKLYQQGYNPVWVLEKADEVVGEEDEIRRIERMLGKIGCQDFLDIYGRFLKPGTALYIEDPFGKTEIEEMQLIASRRIVDIGELVEGIRRRMQVERAAKVIITSRRRIFERAIAPDSPLSDIIIPLRSDMRVASDGSCGRSYGVEDIQVMWENYARVYYPRWMEDNERSNELLHSLLERPITPLGLSTFVRQSRNVTDIAEVKELLVRSNNLVLSFADEIRKATIEEQVFLLVVSMCKHYPVNLEQVFHAIQSHVRTSDYHPPSLGYTAEQCRRRFRGEIGFSENGSPYFLHPTFQEAVEMLVTDMISNDQLVPLLVCVCTNANDYSEAFVRDRAAGFFRSILARTIQLCANGKAGLGILDGFFESRKSWNLRAMTAEPLAASITVLGDPGVHQYLKLCRDEHWFVRKMCTYPIAVRYTNMPDILRDALDSLCSDQENFVRWAAEHCKYWLRRGSNAPEAKRPAEYVLDLSPVIASLVASVGSRRAASAFTAYEQILRAGVASVVPLVRELEAMEYREDKVMAGVLAGILHELTGRSHGYDWLAWQELRQEWARKAGRESRRSIGDIS